MITWPDGRRAAWISRDGLTMQTWGGATKDGYCACGETGTLNLHTWALFYLFIVVKNIADFFSIMSLKYLF